MSQILVVEDQTNLLRSILRTLNEAGFQTESAETLLDATRLMSSRLDLVVLDLMLPDGSGLEPFALDELLARIRALLRRDTRGTEREFSFRDLTVDPVARTVFRGSRSITMQNRQLELLAYLISHANQIVTRDMIARDVWKESTATWTNVIEVQINQLRKKIEEPDLPGLLHTVRGEGYVLGDPP